jgi:hypothetical protein
MEKMLAEQDLLPPDENAPKLDYIIKDKFLFQTIDKEESLYELWKRLGWEEEGNSVRDLRVFFKIVNGVDPESRKILLRVWEKDRHFGAQFFNSESVLDKEPKPERQAPGFWNYEDDEGLSPDEVFRNDELPRKGHQELHLKQEIREYARYMIWELPLLSSKFN